MPRAEVVAHVAQGKLIGRWLSAAQVASFQGVPYAAEPSGRYRFRAPGSAGSWAGARRADSPGPTAPQSPVNRLWTVPGVDAGPIFGGWVPGPDYLNLNVWTPDPGPNRLPVLVFVHGGGFTGGAGSLALYDGTRFAERGVVLVTVNYRLGAEGFLPLDGGDTNVGLRDLVAALQWVSENVAAFGGDPGNLTLFGESAGASAAVLLASAPATRGLVRRVISQSAGISVVDARYGSRVARQFADVLGVQPTRAAFAGISAPDLIRAQETVAAASGAIDLQGLGTGIERVNANTQYTPSYDADLVPQHPADGFPVGVDLLSGTNRDEMNVYLGPSGILAATTDSSLRREIARVHPEPDRVIACYRAAMPDASPGQLLAAMLTDHDYRVETRAIADSHALRGGSAFSYEFAWASSAADGQVGAGHVVELGFVFDNLDAPGLAGPRGFVGVDPPRELAARMQQAWVDFAATGDPGWPPYGCGPGAVRHIAEQDSMIDDSFAAVREVWAGRA